MTPSSHPPALALVPILTGGAVAAPVLTAPVLAAPAPIGALVRRSGATTVLRCGRVIASDVTSRYGDDSGAPDIAYIQCGDTGGACHGAVNDPFPSAGESWGAPFHGGGRCPAGQWVTITANVANASGADANSIGVTCPGNGEESM